MYNFRYHLVTIVSIFLALAVGLLIGAAITGSDLVRSTSNDMLEDVLGRFSELETENAQLTEDLAFETPFGAQMLRGWQDGRLEGRTIVLLTSEADEDTALASRIATLMEQSGAVAVTVQVAQPDFGTTDEKVVTALQEIVPAVDGRPYNEVLAQALVDEWAYEYVPDPTAKPPATGTTNGTGAPEDAADATSTDPNAASTDLANIGGIGSANTTPAPGTGGATTDPAAVALEAAFDKNYQLTSKLIDLGCITVTVDYHRFIEHEGIDPEGAQAAAWALAGERTLPYAMNGAVDLLVNSSDDGVGVSPDTTGIAIAALVKDKGANEELPYPRFKPTASTTRQPTEEDETGDEEGPATLSAVGDGSSSYFAVLLQDAGRNAGMVENARQRDLSCVTVFGDNAGRYSLVALLSGAQTGIYGSDRAPDSKYPSLPQDPTGLAPFTT
jgi:hypothetical protein